jgi:putative ABC transport system permease protein
VTLFRVLLSRVGGLFGSRRHDAELSDEIQAHLALLASEHVRRGMSSEDAKLAARRDFGGVEHVKEVYRDQRGLPFVDALSQDLRYAFRQLTKNPAFALAAILTLALGIGANTAVFSVVNAVLVRPLPYKDSDRLVRIVENVPAAYSPSARPLRVAGVRLEEFVVWRMRTQTLSHMAAYIPTMTSLTSRDGMVRLTGMQVSPAIFPMLNAQPVLGRVFASGEERPGANTVVLLSHDAWQKYFAGDAAIITKTVTLDGRSYSVVGVMGPEFQFPDPQIEFWRPLVINDSEKGTSTLVSTVARVKDSVSIAAAAAEANVLARDLRGESASAPPSIPPRFEISSVKDEMVAPVKPALRALVGAVACVLLIACVNVANLLLARNANRRREIAVRGALGAGPGRLIRQLLTESMVLAALGGVVGAALAVGGIRLLTALGTVSHSVFMLAPLGDPNVTLPRLAEVRIDGAVLALTITLSVLTGVSCGIAAALPLFRLDLMRVIHEADATSSGFVLNRRFRTRGLLVILEIGLAMTLLVSAGLLIRSFGKLSTVKTGYDPANVLTFQVAWPKDRYSVASRTTLSEELTQRIRALSRVRSAGFTNILPLTGGRMFFPFGIAGVPPQPSSRQERPPQALIVSPDYLLTMGVHLIEGRWFGDHDGPGRPQALLINRTLARRYFPDGNPVGALVMSLGSTPWQIVGVVDDVRENSLDTAPGPQIYIDVRQVPASSERLVAPAFGSVFFTVRTTSDPTSIVSDVRGIVRQLDPQATLDGVTTMEKRVSDAVARPRFHAVVLGVFAAVAVLLVAVGIYGLIAYSVAQCTREIGIRVALGARRADVMRLVVHQGFLVIGVGLACGLAGAAALTRYLNALLFGLTPLDPSTFIGASLMFVFVAALALYVPARRATKLDPLVSLRCE